MAQHGVAAVDLKLENLGKILMLVSKVSHLTKGNLKASLKCLEYDECLDSRLTLFCFELTLRSFVVVSVVKKLDTDVKTTRPNTYENNIEQRSLLTSTLQLQSSQFNTYRENKI